MYPRVLAVAKHLLDRSKVTGDGSVTPMQLMKLTYMAHAWMLGLCGRSLVDEPVAAWRYGPVFPSLYQVVRIFGSQPVVDIPVYGNAEPFTADELSVMDQVVDIYGRYTGIELSAMTHERGTPWDQAWKRSGQNTTISNDTIEHYYRQKAQAAAPVAQGA